MVAGEASGDLLGSQLIRALRELMPELHFARRHVPEEARITRELVRATELRERSRLVAIAIKDLRDVVIRPRLTGERFAKRSRHG